MADQAWISLMTDISMLHTSWGSKLKTDYSYFPQYYLRLTSISHFLGRATQPCLLPFPKFLTFNLSTGRRCCLGISTYSEYSRLCNCPTVKSRDAAVVAAPMRKLPICTPDLEEPVNNPSDPSVHLTRENLSSIISGQRPI